MIMRSVKASAGAAARVPSETRDCPITLGLTRTATLDQFRTALRSAGWSISSARVLRPESFICRGSLQHLDARTGRDGLRAVVDRGVFALRAHSSAGSTAWIEEATCVVRPLARRLSTGPF